MRAADRLSSSAACQPRDGWGRQPPSQTFPGIMACITDIDSMKAATSLTWTSRFI